jgi:putative spermidine/putrescine transport system permease protein
MRLAGRRGRSGAGLLVGPAVAFLALMGVSSLLLMVSYSVRTAQTTALLAPFSLSTWRVFFDQPYNLGILWTTLEISVVVDVITVLLAYPTAWCLSRMKRGARLSAALLLVFSPIFVSVVVRSYGWMLLLSDNGLIGRYSPVPLLYHAPGVIIALVHVELPFAVFPILSVMMNLRHEQLEAAADLGAGPVLRFRRVLLPATLPGVVAAGQIVFALTVSAFATPALLGGGRVNVLSQAVYNDISQLDWPLAAVEAVVLVAVALVVLLLFGRLRRLVDTGTGQGAGAAGGRS